MSYYAIMESPIDSLLLISDGECLTALHTDAEDKVSGLAKDCRRDSGPFREAIEQLSEYFAGERQSFTLRLRASGTHFQKSVWKALTEIPFGVTASYRDIAEKIGSPKAVRAVGLANGRNPIGIIVPCHRVIGANGKLTGYAGGLPRKRWLLSHEAQQRGLAIT
ncbi:methylated-DNA--[protein]-cysteine S-methyltransferase [Proteobacteria bacterium 005FR1]|nr:methylated-DNA--[protein]-cysteine S-methyltransferase [Proteobacteria bacterium 005FR1]